MENIMKGTMWVFSILMIGILVSCGNVATTADPPSEEQTGTISQEPSTNAFVTRWMITEPGTVITLPLGSYHTTPQPVVYDFTVHWGDGSPEDRITDLNDAKKSHSYNSAGTYDITITGMCEGWDFGVSPESREYIVAVLSWGMQPDFAGFKRISFEECYNLASLPAGGIRGTIQNFYRSFYKCSSLTEIPEDLFLYSENATGFCTCFSKTAISAIPPALFAATHGRDFDITFEGCENLRAIPEDLFANNRRAWSFERCFSDCTGLTSIPEGLFFGAPEADTFCSVFKGCSNIRALPGALFSRNLEAVDLSFIVSNCVNLESIPEELFTCNANAETFKGAFFGCNSLVTLPEGLFRHNPNVENFSWCFSDCSLLAELPRELFADNRNALDFSYCFRSCYSLRMSPDIFYSDGDQGTRFLGQSVNFTGCFSRSAAYPGAISGNAPDLWNCAGTMTTTECFGDSGNNAAVLANYEQIPGSWK